MTCRPIRRRSTDLLLPLLLLAAGSWALAQAQVGSASPQATPQAAVAAAHTEQAALGIRRCLDCHSDPQMKAQDAEGGQWTLFVDEEKYLAQTSEHKKFDCSECHTSMAPADQPKPLYTAPTKGWDEALAGIREARREAILACMGCHSQEAKEYCDSIHGQGFLQDNPDVPLCQDCHGHHYIDRTEDTLSPVHPLRVPATCAQCHADEDLIRRNDLPPQQVETYLESYHGIANRFGNLTTAHCASCHSAHNIRPSSDRRSPVHPANLAATCSACHPGATDTVAKGKVHVVPSPRETPALYCVIVGFRWLTIGTMAMLLGHICLDVFARLRERRRKPRTSLAQPQTAPLGSDQEPVERLSFWFRVQHILLALSCLLLIVTGMPLKFPDSPFAHWLFGRPGGLECSGILHRIGATILIAVAVFHVFYITLTRPGRNDFRHLMPRWKDVVDVVHNVLFFFGLRTERPHFARFAYYEKFDYWAVYWGCVIMIGSGLMLWFEVLCMRLFTKTGFDIALEAHSDEGLLAALAILVWHFYNVHFNLDRFPMSWMWWDGKITIEEMREYHAAEYEELCAEQLAAADAAERQADQESPPEPMAGEPDA